MASASVSFLGANNRGIEVGHNLGEIHVHIPDKRFPRSPPPPSAVIPFRRDRDFIERGVLGEIRQRAFQHAERIGLVGLGGVGKSQLAIEYVYRVREQNPNMWVFWVHASNAARFEESYRKIAERLQLTGWDDQKVDILSIVYGWLSNEHNGQWTMVLDNADIPEVVFQLWKNRSSEPGPPQTPLLTVSHSLSDYLPSSPNGLIIITSRSQEVMDGLIQYKEDILKVRPMDEETATALLRKKLQNYVKDGAEQDSTDLVQQLDYMPLAISQAAAYIRKCAPLVTVPTYLQILKRSDHDRTKLLRRDVPDPQRDGRALNSIMATWDISFNYIRQTRDSASRLLALMSLFDREAIPGDLLRGQYIENQDKSEIDFEEDIATLRGYHLIGIGMSDNLFDMHRLVQFSTKKWLERKGELERWQTRYLKVLEAFSTQDNATWRTYQALFPHVEALVAYRVEKTDYLKVWMSVLYRVSSYALESGRYGVAQRIAKASLEVYEAVYGLDAVQTLQCVNILAGALHLGGKNDEAEVMIRRVLAGNEKVQGEDHPNTLKSVSNLAEVLQYQGKYNEAGSMHRRALAGYEKISGADHPDMLMSMDNLAVVLRHQGNYDESESMNRHALARMEKILGEDDTDTLTSVSNLAEVLQYQGKYNEAGSMHQRALSGREKILGVDHPDTLASVGSLAMVLLHQGKHDEAESFIRRALSGMEKMLGLDHPDTLESVDNLAVVLRYQEKYDEAGSMHRQALAGREKVLGVDHPDTLTSVDNLAVVLRYQEKYDEAGSMHRQALARREKVLRVDHPDTLTSVDNLAVVLRCQEKYDEAGSMHRQALAGREKVLGVDHPDTLTSVDNLAVVLRCQEKYDEAGSMHRQALAGREKVLGVDHPDTLTSVDNLAVVLRCQEKYDEAGSMHRQALAGRETTEREKPWYLNVRLILGCVAGSLLWYLYTRNMLSLPGGFENSL